MQHHCHPTRQLLSNLFIQKPEFRPEGINRASILIVEFIRDAFSNPRQLKIVLIDQKTKISVRN